MQILMCLFNSVSIWKEICDPAKRYILKKQDFSEFHC